MCEVNYELNCVNVELKNFHNGELNDLLFFINYADSDIEALKKFI